ncbi:glycosyltransferase family 4 protein [Desulfosarcina ovata]|uniref:Glycoside hydrolase n=1 Tax=Desulfosarcina ovata subsp. ovata TaxID=2752305 RepID=A0A5K8A3K5_9BACT|nr:glycosyltransferase family 4 protein [Desulfosarcina ovata]BBO87112.1 glycoside hydrolase [Desulfosarcina ovata subsp. ovata]
MPKNLPYCKKPLSIRILHVLSQRPDSTGSGIYIQAMLREAERKGHRNFLVAGVQSDWPPQLPCIDNDHCRMVTFGEGDLPFAIAGMSDVMPYTSTRFCDLSADAINAYKAAFTRHLREVVDIFQPDLIHSHHLWLVTALTRQLFPHIPLLTTCHGSDLRQFQNCADLRSHVISGCQGIDAVMALSHAQKQTIVKLYDMVPESVHVVGAGYNAERFTQTVKPLPEPVQLVYAGKLSHAKGVPWLLQALSSIDTPDWHLHLVGGGSGEEKEHCLALARQLGDRLTVHGAVPQQQLAEIMGQAHLFVLPSLFEGSNCNFEMALFATQTEVFFNQSSMHLFSLLFQNVLDTEACNGYKRVNTHPLLPKASQGHAIARTRRKPHPT